MSFASQGRSFQPLSTALLAVTFLSATARSSCAATFTIFWFPSERVKAGITIEGEIQDGDASRFMEALNTVAHSRPGAHVVVVDLDTSGGLVEAAWTIATIVRLNGYNTGLYPGQTCASACSLIFFAGNNKILGAGARVGVHRASLAISGAETLGTVDISIVMAERLRNLGANKSVVNKLLRTPPDGVAWLTAADLVGVQGIVFGPPHLIPKDQMPSDEYAAGWHLGEEAGTEACPQDLTQFANACRAGAAPSVPSNTVATTVTSPPVDPNSQPFSIAFLPAQTPKSAPVTQAGTSQLTSSAFEQGLADRRGWEEWFSSLSGDYRAGAEYWAGQRSTPRPESCSGAAGQRLGEWISGCLAARERLASLDQRRRSEPEYRRGWNSR